MWQSSLTDNGAIRGLTSITGSDSLTFTVWDWKSYLAALALCAGVGSAERAITLPEGPGKRIIETACSSCHGLDVVTSKKLSRQRWRVLVLAMTDNASGLTAAGRDAAVEYLAKNFGEKDRGKELVEEICSLCHEVDRIKEQHLGKDEWAGVIKGMIFEGAPVTDEEFSMIVDYLARNFGKTKD